MNQIESFLTRILQPHLSKQLKNNIMFSSKLDWRQDPRRLGVPTPREFIRNQVSSENINHLTSPRMRDLRNPYRILCLDGGGIKGALTISLLCRIIRHNPTFLDQVDFICGTSAGGILSLLLSAGYSPVESKDLFVWAANHIFRHSPWRKINPFRSKYSDKFKEEIFREYFGDRTMLDTSKTCAVVSTIRSILSVSYFRYLRI